MKAVLQLATCWLACAEPADAVSGRAEPRSAIITVVATSDVHGHLERLPLLAGYVRVLRDKRTADGGVLLVDAGDMWQGTLESNLSEGAPMVRAYNALGYAAAAVGNHEFDYGPEGEAATPRQPSDDPRGALKARAREAKFPLLAANVLEEASGKRVMWPNVAASVIVPVAGVKVGVVGVTTEATTRSTIAANVRGLHIASLPNTLSVEAQRLRDQGAKVVVALAHAGGDCAKFDSPDDVSSCEPTEEIFQVAGQLAPGTVDLIVAGHTHAGVAHRVNGTPIIQAYSKARAFARADIDVRVDKVAGVRLFPPKELEPGEYEGRGVAPDPSLQQIISPDMERARKRREQKIGVVLTSNFRRNYDNESSLGNLFSDLMRESQPGLDVALMNGGGLRADLPAGELTYGALFEAMPFDNRLVVIEMSVAELKKVLVRNMQSTIGILSISGIRFVGRCESGVLRGTLLRADGSRVADDEKLSVAVSDFLLTGGDGALTDIKFALRSTDEGQAIRDLFESGLKKRNRLGPAGLLSLKHPRVHCPGQRPVHCP